MIYHTRQAPAPDTRCAWPGCSAAPAYPAPRAPDRLHEYVWFCLDHVRIYNREWSWLPGADQAETAAPPRGGGTRRRRPDGRFRARPFLEDPYGIVPGLEGGAPPCRRWPPGSPEAEAAAAMALSDDITLPALKSRYKELVKHHHPDANGGSPASEERMKSITRAYRVLHQALAAAPAQ